MKARIQEFIKTKDFLVCVDSDGCAMDTMDIKHEKCFGPKAIEVWGLESIYDQFMKVWLNVNLYSKTRGINRFKGLVLTFEILAEQGYNVPNLSSVKTWANTTKELSAPSLISEIDKLNDEQLKNALSWSNRVNQSIKEDLFGKDHPFPNVKEGLKAIEKMTDIAIVSSANSEAVLDEWTRHELSPYVSVMLGQEAGTKTACIAKLKAKGFSDLKVLMVGDAPGDLEAAKKNNVLFYPIIVGKEGFSWERLKNEAIYKFLDGTYTGIYQEQLINEFWSVLK